MYLVESLHVHRRLHNQYILSNTKLCSLMKQSVLSYIGSWSTIGCSTIGRVFFAPLLTFVCDFWPYVFFFLRAFVSGWLCGLTFKCSCRNMLMLRYCESMERACFFSHLTSRGLLTVWSIFALLGFFIFLGPKCNTLAIGVFSLFASWGGIFNSSGLVHWRYGFDLQSWGHYCPYVT